MYAEDELLPISALQHYLYCPRQCALIHLERVWAENRYTAEGRILHAVADSGRVRGRGGVRARGGMPVRSLRLGLTGVADVVEFGAVPGAPQVPYPVEYKRGRPKDQDWDRVQLCAQALCLEEMLDVSVPEGALFYGQRKRREVVIFDDALRAKTTETAARVHALLGDGATPAPGSAGRCRNCSLRPLCRPEAIRRRGGVRHYVAEALKDL